MLHSKKIGRVAIEKVNKILVPFLSENIWLTRRSLESTKGMLYSFLNCWNRF